MKRKVFARHGDEPDVDWIPRDLLEFFELELELPPALSAGGVAVSVSLVPGTTAYFLLVAESTVAPPVPETVV